MIPSALTIAAGTSSGRVQRGERDEVRAVGEVRLDRARGLQGESCLADPAGPGEGEQPHRPGPQPLADRGDVVLATDRAVRRHRQPAVAQRARRRTVAAPRASLGRRLGGRRELGGVLEDVLVQLAQRLCGLDAELVDEPSARGLEGRQRVGLSSGSDRAPASAARPGAP